MNEMMNNEIDQLLYTLSIGALRNVRLKAYPYLGVWDVYTEDGDEMIAMGLSHFEAESIVKVHNMEVGR